MLDWLLGRPYSETAGTPVRRLAPMRLNVDDIRDVANVVTKRTGWPVIIPNVYPTPVGVRPISDLDNLSPYELAHLTIVADGQDNVNGTFGAMNATVTLAYGHECQITWTLDDARAIQAAETFTLLLTDAGRRRLTMTRIAPASRGALIAAIIGTWLWVLLATHEPASLAIFSGLLAAVVAVTGIDSYNRLIRPRLSGPNLGVRIDTKSRAELRTERANRHANVRVAAWSGVVAVVLGWALGFISHGR
jgi:hypothetical protein